MATAKEMEARCHDTRCPKCGHFLSTFVGGSFNPKALKACRECKSRLGIRNGHIAVIGSMMGKWL